MEGEPGSIRNVTTDHLRKLIVRLHLQYLRRVMKYHEDRITETKRSTVFFRLLPRKVSGTV